MILANVLQNVDDVMVINTGFLSKKKSPGTFAQMRVLPRTITEAEQSEEKIPHNIFERARIDVVRI